MLTIYLHRSQQGLLEELRILCPDLEPARRSLSPSHATYHSYLDEQDEGRSQKRWLAEHDILFVDTERQRERRVHNFLRGVVLDPNGEEVVVSFAREAGLRHVQERVIDLPMGEWGGRVGVLLKEDLVSAFASLKTLYAGRGPEEEFEALLQALPAEWEAYHSCYRFFAFYGQK